MKDVCATCRRPIFWLAHEKTGKPAPIESCLPSEGNVVPMIRAAADLFEVVDPMHAATHYRVIGIRGNGPRPATGYRSHFASCKDAPHWRDRGVKP